MSLKRVLAALSLILLFAMLLRLATTPSDTLAANLYPPSRQPLQQPEPEKTPQKVVPVLPGEDPSLEEPPAAVDIVQTPIDQAVKAAFEQAVEENLASVPVMTTFDARIDSIHYSEDGSAALLWIALVDKQTHEVLATEPEAVIARRLPDSTADDPASWSMTFRTNAQSSPDSSAPGGASSTAWADQLRALPADLLSTETGALLLSGLEAKDQAQSVPSMAYETFTGYKLPWAAGIEKRLSGSIGHFLIYNSCSQADCRYAYDIADGTMFPVLAAKGGVVRAFRTTCANGDSGCTNYLTLEDNSTVPTTYQLYYHLAYNTLPSRLRNIGAQVLQGEYVSNADDTGYSSGHHLHFHVYVNPSPTSGYFWGSSVKYSFDDVNINGGEMRTCYEATNFPAYGTECRVGGDGKRGTADDDWFKSGNIPAHPPTGTITNPVDRAWVTSQTVTVSGTAYDDVGISRIQVLAYFNNAWKSIDDIAPTMGAYSKEVDLCAANIPDGPMALTVRIYDREGGQNNGLPVRQIIKNYACGGTPPVPPPPACTPGDSQVALYSEPDYRGSCQKFDVSESGYSSSALTLVGNDNAASIQVGSNARATLYDRSGDVTTAVIQGRSETFESADANLADNRIGADRVSGLWVVARSIPPDEAFFNSLVGNHSAAGYNPTSVDSLVLSWEAGDGATSFNASLSGPKSLSTTLTGSSLSVGSLPAGSYSLLVTANNSAGSNGSIKTFTVNPATLPSAAVRTVPYQENLETSSGDWSATGLWRYTSVDLGSWPLTKAWMYNSADNAAGNYGVGGTGANDYRAGDLTSPPITILANETYYLRFAYFMDVEDGNPHWDQRWVQISVDNGPFTDLRQLSDDKQAIQSWLNSGPISLADYAGKTVRIRFHFDTVDEDQNTGKGWAIDDVSINAIAPNTSCADDGSIPVLSMGATLSGTICPEGDQDFYKISAVAGQAIGLDVDARSLSPASKLDSVIYLLDADRRSLLAWNDDESYGKVVDSLLTYTFNRAGTYYAKVTPWDYPGAGGASHVYNLTLKPLESLLRSPKSVAITYPLSPALTPSVPFEISVAASDYDDGPVAQVNFFWHGPDWSNPTWVKLTSDTTPGDGWTVILDPLAYGNVSGSALYVQAVSRVGGVSGVVWWDFQPDLNAPISRMDALPAQTNTTLFRLSWQSSDASNDIDHYDLQFQANGSGWYDFVSGSYPAYVSSTWFIGLPGNTYGFRVRGVDRMGNEENYTSVQTSTTLPGTCIPEGESVGNAISNAVGLIAGQESAIYNFCRTNQVGGGAQDEDWFSVSVPAVGKRLMLNTFSRGGNATLTMALYNSAGALQASWTSNDFGMDVSGSFVPTVPGTYYLKVSPLASGPLAGNPYGTDVRYQVWYNQVKDYFVPLVSR